jgi:hypothetical protein
MSVSVNISMMARLALLCGALGLLSCTAKDSDPRAEKFASLPDWRGLWVAEGMDADISGYPREGLKAVTIQLMGTNAPWTEAQRAKLAAMAPEIQKAAATGKSSGWGYPMMMESFAALQFLITPEETLIMNFYRDVRHVYTDGREHPAEEDRWPTPWGDSVGRWEGDTLVIDTVSVQQPGILYIPLPMLSEQARYVERLRKTAPGRIESELTIEDPATLTAPWVIKLAYLRVPELDRMIHEVFDNDRVEVEGDVLGITPPRE